MMFASLSSLSLVVILLCDTSAEVRPIQVSINTKFLNFLQPKWSKYVTMVRHNQTEGIALYVQLYDSLIQFEPHVLASKARNAAKNHDPLAMLAHSNASSSQSHANSSYSPQPYYVTHPSSCYNCNEKGHYARDYQKPRVRDAKHFREQMLLAMKDEARSNLKDEENDFMLDNSYGDETLEELTVVVIMMARIQPADDNADFEPSYDAKAVSEKNEMLSNELKKSSSDSKDIQANLLKRMKILENDFKRSQAQGIDFELKLQHQKEKMACDVAWKSRLPTLNDENVLLKTQVDSVVQEREVDELIEHVNQKTYAYGDVRSQNQDLLMTVSEFKNKIKTIEKEKNVNTKFDNSKTSGTLFYVTPLPKNIVVKAKKVLNTKVNTDKSKPVTSHSIPKKSKVKNKVRMLSQEECVESSNSVRRPQSNDTKSKDKVLKNNNDKRSSTHDRKMSSSVNVDFNKRKTMNLS
nr:hypothetical protein [Tanacetum cinerariifolium]